MIWVIVTVCLLVLGLIAVCLSPMRSRLAELSARMSQSRGSVLGAFDQSRFGCRVNQFSDESQPQRQDQFFRVQMMGRIPTKQDNVDTDVRIEILDVTEGYTHPHRILSSDEDHRDAETAEFQWRQHNGKVPAKNSILSRWVTIGEFPCHVLRFAYRGRRKLLFHVTVLEKESDQEIVSAQKTLEYVYCSDGYREVHDRRLEVLQACLELALLGYGNKPVTEAIEQMWSEWIRNMAEMYLSVEEAAKVISDVQSRLSSVTAQRSSDVILAYGKNTDRFFAAELALQTKGMDSTVSSEDLKKLFEISNFLEIQKDRFLNIAQKILLSSECKIQDPGQLLGIEAEMGDESFRKQLNEEYRKWNARVTHPDPQVRSKADQILTLIAEIRSQWLQATS